MSDDITIAKPEERKSWVQKFVDQARGQITHAPPATPAAYVRETGSTVGEYAEGGLIGSLLGAAHAKWSLDTKGGPIDGWLAGIGALGSVGLSAYAPQLALRARKLGLASFTILSFRKGYEVVRHQPLAGGTGGGVQHVAAPSRGAADEDPIERVAKGLG